MGRLLISLLCILVLPTNSFSDTYTMRVTAYITSKNKTAIGQRTIVGKTAAISPKCKHLLREYVHIEGHGVYFINDLTSKKLDKIHNKCTIDIVVANKDHARKVGSSTRLVRKIN